MAFVVLTRVSVYGAPSRTVTPTMVTVGFTAGGTVTAGSGTAVVVLTRVAVPGTAVGHGAQPVTVVATLPAAGVVGTVTAGAKVVLTGVRVLGTGHDPVTREVLDLRDIQDQPGTQVTEVGENLTDTKPPRTQTVQTFLGRSVGGTPVVVTATILASTSTVGNTGGGGSAGGGPIRITAGFTADGLGSYKQGSSAPVVAHLWAAGIVEFLPSSLLADRWYSLLPAVYRAEDAKDDSIAMGKPLYRYLNSQMSTLQIPGIIAQRIADGEFTDPELADDAWVPWLAQAAGVAGSGVDQMRARLAALAVSPALGSVPYLIALIRQQLTGTKAIEFYSTPPWTINVRVNSDELGLVGGTTAGLRAAIYASGRVPTGFLIVIDTTIQTFGQIDAAYDQWADSAGATWGTVDSAGL